MKRNVQGFRARTGWLSAGLLLAALVFSGCALTPEAREARFLKLGKSYMEKKDYSRAAIEFQNAIRVRKADAEPYYQLSLAYMAIGDYRSGIPVLKTALDLNPNNLRARVKMAEVLGAANGEQYLHDAETEARKVLAVRPEDADALNALAIAEWKLGEHRNAEMDFVRAIHRAPQNLQASLNLAAIKMNQKDMAGAEQIIQQAVAANPKSAGPVAALGGLYLMMGKTEAAEQQYRRAVQLDPKSEIALLSLAGLYAGTNRMAQADPLYKQISGLPDRKYKSIHARFLFQSGKHDESIAEFEKLYKADTSDRDTRTQLVEAYFAAGKLSNAEQVLSEALKHNPKDADALLQRSRAYLTARSYTEAEKDVAQVLRFEPDSAPAHFIMARLYQARGEALTARQELYEALRLNKHLLPARVDLAQLLLNSNAAQAALQVLQDTPDEQRTPTVRVLQNWALWSLGDLADLRKGIDEGLKVARTPDLLVQDALLKLRQGKPAEARAAVEEALKLNPGNLRALSVLTSSYTEQKQASMALQKVKEYAALQPKSAPLQQFLGNLLIANGHPDEGRRILTAASEGAAGFVPLSLELAQLDAKENKWNDAEARLKKVLSMSPENVTARQWLGDIEILKGNHQEAGKYYRQVLQANADNTSVLNNVAYLMTESGELNQALKYAERAEQLDPENPDYADTMGWILYQKGLYPVAVKQLERAASHNGNAVWKYHLAMAYARVGQPQQARAALDAALKMNSSVPEAKIAKDLVAQSK